MSSIKTTGKFWYAILILYHRKQEGLRYTRSPSCCFLGGLVKRKLFFIVEVLAVSVFFWGYTYDLLKCSGKVVGILITEAGCNFIDGRLGGAEKAACTLHF